MKVIQDGLKHVHIDICSVCRIGVLADLDGL